MNLCFYYFWVLPVGITYPDFWASLVFVNLCILLHQAASLSEEIISVNSMEDVREAFPTSFDGIPDAKAVYEARKKREILRQVLILFF